MSSDPNSPDGRLHADAGSCAECCVEHSFSFREHLLSLIFFGLLWCGSYDVGDHVHMNKYTQRLLT